MAPDYLDDAIQRGMQKEDVRRLLACDLARELIAAPSFHKMLREIVLDVVVYQNAMKLADQNRDIYDLFVRRGFRLYAKDGKLCCTAVGEKKSLPNDLKVVAEVYYNQLRDYCERRTQITHAAMWMPPGGQP